jgi:hypothetical protein
MEVMAFKEYFPLKFFLTHILGFAAFLFFEPAFCYVAQAGHELAILLPQPPEYWNYSGVLHSQISLPTPPPCFFSTGV